MPSRFKIFFLLIVVTVAATLLAQTAPPAPEAAQSPVVAPAPVAPTTGTTPLVAPAPPSPGAAPVAAPAPDAKPPVAPVPPQPPIPPVPPRHFQLDYVVKEVENGKVTNSRTYSIIVAANGEGRREQIRTGSRVPVITADGDRKQFQYIDLGVDIDSSDVREKQGQLWLRVSAEVSSRSPASSPDSGTPIIRRNRWESNVTVPVNKPVVIFSSDDVTSTRTMQLELKATPIKQ